MVRSYEVSTIALFASLAVLFRYVKNAVTAVQFVNFPLLFTILSSLFLGSRAGFFVGLLSYTISDLLIFPGIWTIVNSLLAGFMGFLWGLARRRKWSGVELFAWLYLSIFFFDILSSFILYVAIGFKPLDALTWGIVGLFLPVFGGSLIGVGPITELCTSLLTYVLFRELEKRGVFYEGVF